MSQAFRILTALVAGLAIGMALANWAPGFGAHVLVGTKLIGSAWVHGLQMVIVPLVVALLVIGIAASAEAAKAGKIAARALVFFVAILWINTLIAAFLMPLLLQLFPLRADWASALRASLPPANPDAHIPTLIEFFDKIVPTNILDAAASDAFLSMTVLRDGVRVRDHAPAGRAPQAPGRFLSGDRRRDGGGDQLGAGARADRRVLPVARGRDGGGRGGVRRAGALRRDGLARSASSCCCRPIRWR